MSHEEWVLHRNFEHTIQLLEYVSSNIMNNDYKKGEYLHEAILELGKHIWMELDKFAKET